MGRTSTARERLLQSAIDLIWTNSYAAVGVDQICERAGVRKGSFYHFFPSKTDLALEAYETHWKSIQPEMDALFSPLVPPLERIERWCRALAEHQLALHAQHGCICGCPYANVGTELGTQDPRIRNKVAEIFARAQCYLESAIRELEATGWVLPGDVRSTAQAIHSCELGILVRAKVANDPGILQELLPAVHRLLGVGQPGRIGAKPALAHRES